MAKNNNPRLTDPVTETLKGDASHTKMFSGFAETPEYKSLLANRDSVSEEEFRKCLDEAYATFLED